MRSSLCLTVCAVLTVTVPMWAADPEPSAKAATKPAAEPSAEVKKLVDEAVAAVGGADKLLKLFRVKEELNVSPDPAKKGKPRSSVIEPPGHWWLGKRERVHDDKEPAIFLVWAWTLGAITSPTSTLELLPEISEDGKPAVGLRVSGSVTPPMDLYFDKANKLLVRADWRADIHRFSDWREHDGVKYAAKVVGYNKSTKKPWYFTEVVEVERLKELPAEYKRRE